MPVVSALERLRLAGKIGYVFLFAHQKLWLAFSVYTRITLT